MHVDSAGKKQTAKLNGLYTEKGLRGMTERGKYFAVGTVFPFVATYIDRNLDFVERCNLTPMNVLYIEREKDVLLDQRKGR